MTAVRVRPRRSAMKPASIWSCCRRSSGHSVMPRVDDPDAAVHAAGRQPKPRRRARSSSTMGLEPRAGDRRDTRMLGHGLAQTAEAMRQVVLEAGDPSPARTELQTRAGLRGLGAADVAAARTAGVRTCCACSCGTPLETEAVSVAERAAGTPSRSAQGRRWRFADLCRLHPPGRGGAAGGAGEPGQPAVRPRSRRRRRHRCGSSRRSATR